MLFSAGEVWIVLLVWVAKNILSDVVEGSILDNVRMGMAAVMACMVVYYVGCLQYL